MNLEIEAVYENGVLKLEQPLPVPELQRVRVTIHLPSRVEQSAGLVPRTGTVEDLEYLAESPENEPGSEHDASLHDVPA
jgi:predicted DNA-binding antitoxin AbrB/MazE fold protein